MKQSDRFWYQLPVEDALNLAKQPFANLKSVLTFDKISVAFTALDDFDQSLRRSGRWLIETGADFELLMFDGRILGQPADRNGNFVADLCHGPVKSALADLPPRRALLPAGSGMMRRGGITVLDADHTARCRADLRILTGTGTKAAAIVSLQGLPGCDEFLAEVRKQVEACGGTATGLKDLHAALFPGQGAYIAKPKIVIAAADTAFAAATSIISSYIPVVRANEAGIIADHDTEFLHDYRIALRKIRSVLSLLEGVYAEKLTDEIKTRFSDLMAPTGRLRDLDVYLLEKQRYFDLLPETMHGGLDRMFDVFAHDRTVAKSRLARHLRSKNYQTEISSLAARFDKPRKLHPGPMADAGAEVFACALIWNRYQKTVKTAARIGPKTDDAKVHRLRIHCKKLRYLMEFFEPLFPKPEVKALLKPLKLLQDHLGLFNDCAVQQISLQTLLRRKKRWPKAVNREVAQSVGALKAVLHQRQIELRATLAESFAQFNGPATQNAFRDLFHVGKTTA